MKKSISVCITVWLTLLSGCIPVQTDRIGSTLAVPDYSPPGFEAGTVETAGEAGSDAGQKISLKNILTLSPAETYSRIDQERLFSIALKDADLQDVLSLLSTESGVPIVAGKGAAGKITITIEDRSLGDTLYAILEPLGLTANVDRGIIVVEQPRLVSRTFELNYITDRRTSTSTTNASVSASSGSGSGSSVMTSGGSSGSGSQGNVSVSTTGSTDFWPEIKEGLEAIIFGAAGSGDKGAKQLVINEMAGLIYVMDYSDNMENIASFLADVEKAVKRQVLIQAHIVEVTLGDTFEMGIDWDYFLNKNSLDIDFLQNVIPVDASKVFQIDLQSSDFNMLLDAMKDLGQVNMLSSPKVSTLNNQKAVIKLTTKEVTWITETIASGNSDLYETSTYPQIDEVGLFLDVTPSINGSGRITMQIHPSISNIVDTSYSPGGPDDERSSKPVINVREVDTIADVKSGQTVVIAGLISDRYSSSRTSIPGLGELPLLGNLFSHVKQEKSKVELVIFVTPYILDDRIIDRIQAEHMERMDLTAEINSLVVQPKSYKKEQVPVE